MKQGGKWGGCMISGELAMLSVMAYTEEHDGQFPDAATWQSDTEEYYERLLTKMNTDFEEIPDWIGLDFDLAEVGEPITCQWNEEVTTGFIFNENLDGKNVEDFEDLDELPVIFESNQYGYNGHGDAEAIDNDAKILKEIRREGWMVYMADTKTMSLESSNAQFNIDMSVKDALPPKEPASEEETEGADDGESTDNQVQESAEDNAEGADNAVSEGN